MKDKKANEFLLQQEEEILTLKSIFHDEFVQLPDLPSVWKTGKKLIQFKMALKATPMGDNDPIYTKAEIYAKFPETYPDVPPEIKIESVEGLVLEELQKFTDEQVEEQGLGECLIFPVIQSIQDYLNDRNFPSLSIHEEMEQRKQIEEEKAEKEDQLKLHDQKDNRRFIDLELAKTISISTKKIEEEKKQRKKSRREHNDVKKGSVEDLTEKTEGYQRIQHLRVSNGNSQMYIGLSMADQKLVMIHEYTIISRNRRVRLADSANLGTGRRLKKIETISKDLSIIENVRQENVAALLAMTYKAQGDIITVEVISEFVGTSCLRDLVKSLGHIEIHLIQKFSRQILHALEHIHKLGIFHGDVSTINCLFDQDGVLRLYGCSFTRKLGDICEASKDIGQIQGDWPPPEVLSQLGYVEKSDIWGLGCLILDLHNIQFSEKATIKTVLAMLPQNCPPLMTDFLNRCFTSSSKDRPSASHLLKHQFLWPQEISTVISPATPRNNYNSNDQLNFFKETPVTFGKKQKNFPNEDLNDKFNFDDIPPATTGGKSINFDSLASGLVLHQNAKLSRSIQNVPLNNDLKGSPLDVSSSLPSSNAGFFNFNTASSPQAKIEPKPTWSRYGSDFQELCFLGSGGFGEVHKVRNWLDGRYYAIKKIKLEAKDEEFNKRIIREVTLLSQLHHEYIVRYYQAWIEAADDEDGENKPEGSDLSDDLGVSNESDSDDFTDGFFPGGFEDNSSLRYDPSYNSSEDDGMIVFGGGDETSYKVESDWLTRTEGDSDLLIDYRKSKAEESIQEEKTYILPRYLYIQMEFCGDTLTNLISEEMNKDEVWRLFRQIVEGLLHIHEKGMIHRDLKPSNIFIDYNHNVKIGDFGLATADYQREKAAGSPSNPTANPNNTSSARTFSLEVPEATDGASNEEDNSLTQGVGTALYVSPELAKASRGLRYTQKVDLYSLGIIFFEMLYQFETKMERVKIIQNLRNEKIIFPDDFDMDSRAAEANIIRSLLDHNPKARPTAGELLKNERLPPKMEDAFIHEIERTLANPDTAFYHALMNSLFSQQGHRHLDYTYDLATYPPEHDFSNDTLIPSRSVWNTILPVFQRHGAIELRTPLFMPKTETVPESSAVMIDRSGALVALPFDLTIPFARYVARKRVKSLKRFCLGKVYRENKPAGQAFREISELDFDIVDINTSSLLPDAEVISVLSEIIRELDDKNESPYMILLTHSDLSAAIFAEHNISDDGIRVVMNVMSQHSKADPMEIRKHLVHQARISYSIADALLSFFKVKGNIETVRKQLQTLFKKSSSLQNRLFNNAINQLKQLLTHLSCMAIREKIIIDVGVLPNNMYATGCTYQFVKILPTKKKESGIQKFETLASGGRCDKLIEGLRYPQDRSVPVSSCGVSIAFEKLVAEEINRKQLAKTTLETFRDLHNVCDVYVCSLGPDLTTERIRLARLLWDSGLRTQLSYNGNLSMEEVQELCRSQGIPIIVLIKGHGSLRIKNLITKSDQDVVLSDLVPYLEQSLKKKDLSASEKKTSNLPNRPSLSHTAPSAAINITATVVSVEKVPTNKKKRIINRALQAISPTFLAFKTSSPCNILCLDLSSDIIKKIASSFDLNDPKSLLTTLDHVKGIKKLIELVWYQLQEEAQERRPFCFLFSVKHETFEIFLLPVTKRK